MIIKNINAIKINGLYYMKNKKKICGFVFLKVSLINKISLDVH